MNRKDFLASTGTLMLAGALPGAAGIEPAEEAAAPKIPPYLKRGDLIGITAPAGYLLPEDIAPAVKQLQAWGFRVKMGADVGRRSGSLSGTDEERLLDLQQMLDDKEVKAVFCARGGYGSVRIVERIDWSGFRKNPKWITGFSDITVFHSYLNRTLGIASIHSKMGGAFINDMSTAEPIVQDTAESIRKALMGERMEYRQKSHEKNRTGTASGVVVGGNLKTIESLTGSKSDLQTKGKILFVEDVGEHLYSVDRMFWNLEQSGKLDNLAGLIIGGFRIKPTEDPDDELGIDLFDIVWEKVAKYKYPVCFDFPVGHQKNNYALRCGVRHQLTVDKPDVVLQELI